MGLYETLALAYDSLFPPNPATARFLGPPPYPAAEALDMGCATGSEALALAAMGWVARGVDPSGAMVAAARERRAAAGSVAASTSFVTGGMLDVDALCQPASLSLLLCLGNTLPHLHGPSELDTFAAMAFRALEPGGRFVAQILNYDRILAERPPSLPPIRTGALCFLRSYRYREDGYVDFLTEFGDGTETVRDRTALYPLRPRELRSALENAGFAASAAFSDWERSPFSSAASTALILDAYKAR